MLFKNKKNILKYGFFDNYELEGFSPAKKHLPQWYKDIRGYNYNNPGFTENNAPIKNLKSCIPFLDSFVSGYVIELWCDMHIKKVPKEQGYHEVSWGFANPGPVKIRDGNPNPMPVPPGCQPNHYIWQIPYCFETPPGYSVLITHPLNRFDLPFVTLSGIVDSDKAIGPGSYPFFIKEDFEGFIEKGTPIAQIIPFKVEDWKTENDPSLVKRALSNQNKSNNVFFGYYKKNIWNKKNYE